MKLIVVSIIFLFSHQAFGGLLIVGAGLPASGKSSIFRCLAKQFGTESLFLEPEENTWPSGILSNHESRNFNIISWLRSVRVSNLLLAQKKAKSGEIALVDCYYDKLLYFYVDKKDHEWLSSSSNNYHKIIKLLSFQDEKELPVADYIIFFKISKLQWLKNLKKRGRKNDEILKISDYFDAQNSILSACIDQSKRYGTKVIIVNQKEANSTSDLAKEVHRILSNPDELEKTSLKYEGAQVYEF